KNLPHPRAVMDFFDGARFSSYVTAETPCFSVTPPPIWTVKPGVANVYSPLGRLRSLSNSPIGRWRAPCFRARPDGFENQHRQVDTDPMTMPPGEERSGSVRLDPAVLVELHELEQDGDAGLVQSLIEGFRSTGSAELARIREAVA